jgi:hypothetical protein
MTGIEFEEEPQRELEPLPIKEENLLKDYIKERGERPEVREAVSMLVQSPGDLATIHMIWEIQFLRDRVATWSKIYDGALKKLRLQCIVRMKHDPDCKKLLIPEDYCSCGLEDLLCDLHNP